MAIDLPRPPARLWRGLKFILIDWTVTPKMLALNEQRPFVYHLVTTPIATLVFGLLTAAAMAVLIFLGVLPLR